MTLIGNHQNSLQPMANVHFHSSRIIMNLMLVVDVQLLKTDPKNKGNRFDDPSQFFYSFMGCIDHYILV